MAYLLDTHALIWFLEGDEGVGRIRRTNSLTVKNEKGFCAP